MVWRYVKAQLMVLLCGGLVGPIFLIVYFATGADSLLKWMFYVGLLVTAADVLIALAIANFGAKSAAKTQALEQTGVLAVAQITGMGETGTRINDQPLVKLQLHIEGPGITPFDAQDRVIASVIRLGSLTSRRYHAPECGWARHIAPENRVCFDSSQAARTFGYRPCGICDPS